MRPLSNPDFLSVWERGLWLHPLDRSLLALATALPETSYESLADWPLGCRNRALAELRCACFGPSLQAWMTCPQCGERLEFEMDAGSLAREPNEPGPREPIFANGRSFRLPTSRDLARVARESDSRLAAIRLLEGCLLEGGVTRPWCDEDMEEVGEKMARADPLAETRLALQCAACGHEWDETLNIAAFVWTEIEARAKRLLFEIHTLASAYGWTEKEILSLGDRRRASYMEMAQH